MQACGWDDRCTLTTRAASAQWGGIGYEGKYDMYNFAAKSASLAGIQVGKARETEAQLMVMKVEV